MSGAKMLPDHAARFAALADLDRAMLIEAEAGSACRP